ncbi:neuronal acetylcholine receptor subunit beta-4-like [Pecten maximus]|uniref:neuronal acetylcholine receptor subunit beta-4-like n=1 Tax=Pecten maximus TaxID=6579 RepID=UPI001458382B|nr:neuronal acetylcholine receptor subunit beta-4-like [Pecten maximus]
MAGILNVHVLLALLSLVQFTLAQIGADFKVLQNELFNERSYQKTIIPRTRKHRALFISFEFSLRKIIYLDEIEEKLSTKAHLTLEWNDTFLSWNETHFNDISYLYMPQNEVWKPDVSLQNGFTKLKELNWRRRDIGENTVFWTNKVEAEPALKLWSYEPNGVWDLHSSTVDLQQGDVIIFLTLNRRPEHYLLTHICPVILLSVLAIFTFVIPVDSGEKLGYSMTVNLSFSVLLTIFSTSLPVNSRTTSYLAVYLICLLVKGTITVILTAVQIRFHHRPKNIDLPKRYQLVIMISRRLHMCCEIRKKPNKVKVTKIPSSKSDTSDNGPSYPHKLAEEECSEARQTSDEITDSEDELHEVFTWTDLSAALDGLFFCLLSLVDVVLAIVFFTAVY